MILIYSNKNDSSTITVCKWLDCFNIKYYILFFDEIISKDFNLTIDNNTIKIKDANSEITLSEQNISGVWYRKYNTNPKELARELRELHPSLNKYIKQELNGLYTVFFDFFNIKKQLGSFDDRIFSKIYQLKCALSIGLDIPNTTILNTLNLLIKVKNAHRNIITKSITDPPDFTGKKYFASTLTSRIEDITKISDNFMPSLVQKEISKLYEIRTFYLNKKFYSSAIFSQNDKQTVIDLRNYNYDKPNRVVPYNLPKLICEKLIKLFAKLNINTGSVDMIKSTDNKYYFLEINPSGIFEEYSVNCNYYLEKQIALYFSKNYEKN